MNQEKCNICPHNCLVNRKIGKIGKCGAGNKVKIALVSKHDYEEPCISGTAGSGTIFFSCCNLKCKFCQNYKISSEKKGKEYSVEELADIFLDLQKSGVHNINLVSPTIYACYIKEALIIAKEKGLKLPVIYNTGGYDRVETLKELEGLIDVYLPDLKYFDNNIAFRYSGIKNYFDFASKAIKEMYRQVGKPILDENGIIKKGLIIRHLILPNNTKDSINVLKWIRKEIGKDVFVSVMAQYFPTYKAKENNTINRKITKEELEEVHCALEDLELYNGYIQELGEHEEEYVPEF